MKESRILFTGCLWLCGLLLAACGSSGDGDAGQASQAPAASVADLDAMKSRGALRVLLERDRESYLPRDGYALYAERELLSQFATRQGLQADFVYVERFADLLPALAAGRGDVVAANLTVTDARREQFAFTRPLAYSRDTLVVAASQPVPQVDEPLSGRIAAREDTTLLDTARELAAAHPQLELLTVDSANGNDDLLDRLAAGEFAYAVQDGNALSVALEYRDDVRAGPSLTSPRSLAWALRHDNPQLLRALNDFLTEQRLLGEEQTSYVADLPELKQKKRLRMITRNNAASYFLWRGELLGFEYELARRFAENQGMRLEVVVAPSHEALLPMLLDGDGDFISAYLVPTESRVAQGAVFTRPYHYASEVVVGRADETSIDSLAQLAGRRIAVRRSSAYWTHLERMIAVGELDAELQAAPADMETQEIIAAVADGEFDLTVADSHILAIEMTWRDDVAALINLGAEQPHSWAVHPDNEALRAALSAFARENYRGLFYNMRYSKYFENPRHIDGDNDDLVGPGQISPYDDIVRRHAEQYGFDWRLLVAQMHQESRFDPQARSWMGAVGLMQVLPRTAAEFGFEDLEDPDTGIHAGVRYLDWVRERFPTRLPAGERTWFALAGYNAGHGHVRDARRLAAELGLDADRWFGNVEQAMLKLSEPDYAGRARHGYVRGEEPVRYVRAIRDRYLAYTRLLGN